MYFIGFIIRRRRKWFRQFIKNSHVQFIIAPHDISSNRITYIQQLFNEESALLSNGNLDDLPPVLIIDKIGILAELYSISDIAIIGGGFKNKLHNIIEPAAKGNYILFGPKHSRYPEASEMINANIADSFSANRIEN